MKEYERISELVEAGQIAVGVMTDGRHLERGKIWRSGNWRISAKCVADRVIVYHRHGEVSAVIVGDFIDTVAAATPGRRVIRFSNAREIGFTNSNWPEFAESGSSNPIRYVRE